MIYLETEKTLFLWLARLVTSFLVLFFFKTQTVKHDQYTRSDTSCDLKVYV